MVRFASLGSGSRGNATVIEAGRTRLLLDCGFPARETERRLARLGLEPSSLTAILLSHEHTDHSGGAAVMARRFGLPLWLTAGTRGRLPGRTELPEPVVFSCHAPFAIDGLEIVPFPVPHDAREPAQFVIGDGDRRLAVLTDSGHVTPHIKAVVDGCDGLLVECNHDVTMLAEGPYPPALKARVGGGHGHLSNDQAATLLAGLATDRMQHIIAMHLSERNNHPDRVRAALGTALGCEPAWVTTADQGNGVGWRELR